MNRRLLLRPALAALASLLLAFAFHHPDDASAAGQSEDKVTQGALRVVDRSGKPKGDCPLTHTDVRAEVSGFISRVTVTQEFENPFEEKIEAVYVFPLPQDAAVDDMTMVVGGRTIKGRIMRREEARATYEQARARGNVASLLDQERPNVFTQSVANILPGQQVKVVISYVETLKYEAGTYEWSFPMVVGERYIPMKRKQPAAASPAGATAAPDGQEAGDAEDDAQPDLKRVPDAARLNPPRVPKGMRAGHDISVEVSIDAGVPLGKVSSTTHEIEVEPGGAAGAVVRLKDAAVIPNRDFRIKYDVAGGRVEDAVLTHASARGGFFTLILQPPDRVTAEDVTPKELVFVLDTSGSMGGFPIEKAKETMALALDHLYPQDTFNLITFAGATQILFEKPVPATPENLSKAKEFIAGNHGAGGTEMMTAIRAALADSDAADHVRIVCFMTDGMVGNDFEIISEVQKHPNARVFSMGFSATPNRFLLDKMAEYERGEVEYVSEGDDAKQAVQRFHERIRNPLLTDISVEFEGVSVGDVYPKRVPDLFGAKPVALFGRYEHGGRGRVRLKGRTAGGDFVREIPVELPEAEPRHDVLATLWARNRVGELMGQDMAGMQTGQPAGTLREEITRLGLDYRLMTQFTSFVAVEDSVVTDGGPPRRVDVPAETPAQYSLVSANGGVSECVTVTSSADMVNTSSSGTTITVATHSLSELPFKGRSLSSLYLLAPGAVASPGASVPGTQSPGGFSFSGQRPSSNSYDIDGVSANVGIGPGGQSPGASASGASPGLTAGGGANGLAPIAATQELTIRTDVVAPEYGRTAGAQVSVVTRAGTNELHGSLFGSFGDEALDANDWFANSVGRGREQRRLADYGGTLGGPLKRDHLFFFGSYEGQRQRQPAFAFSEVPSLAARGAAPAALRSFFNAFPVPTGAPRADGFAEFAQGFSTPAGLDSFSFRLDGSNEKLSLNARYVIAGSDADGRGAGGASLNTLSRTRGLAQTLTGGLSYVISPNAIGTLRANYSRVSARGSRLLDSFGGASVPEANPQAGGAFVFDLGGRAAALGTAAEVENLQRQVNVVGSLDFVAGTHTLKFGADYRRLSPVVGALPTERQVYFEGVAGALDGTAARDGLFTRAEAGHPVFNNLSAYAQDEWRWTPRLTLTYGVRWELSPAPHAGGGLEPAAFTQVEDLARLAFAAPGTPPWETTYFNFEPRAGLAYQLMGGSGRDETVLRAGFALLYDTGVAEGGHAFGDSHPFLAGGAAFGVPFSPEGAAVETGTRLGVPVSAFDPHLKLPYTLRWHGSIERALGSNNSVSASYVGAAGRRLLLTRTFLDPSPDFSLVRVTTNGARSDYHSARFQFSRRFSRGLQALASYTLSKSLDDFSEDAPARALLRGDAERGPSDFDARHTVSGFVAYDLPAAFKSGAWNALTRRWALDALFNARSSKPVNVVYAFPLSYGFAFLRPDLGGGVPLYIDDPALPGGKRLNPAAFVVPGALRQGTLGRNALRGFPFYQLDLALHRQFDFNERVNLQLRAEAFNLLNHPNFDDPVPTFAFLEAKPGGATALRPDPYFGRSVSARGGGEWVGQAGGFGPLYTSGGARTVQLSLKLTF